MKESERPYRVDLCGGVLLAHAPNSPTNTDLHIYSKGTKEEECSVRVTFSVKDFSQRLDFTFKPSRNRLSLFASRAMLYAALKY